MRRAVALAATVAFLAACGGGSGDGGNVQQPLADKVVRGLCATVDAAGGADPASASSPFYDDAHDGLHLFAAAATDLAPNDAATLLQTMARVEADLETAPPATSLRADAEALLAATTAVLSVLDLDAPPCA